MFLSLKIFLLYVQPAVQSLGTEQASCIITPSRLTIPGNMEKHHMRVNHKTACSFHVYLRLASAE